MRTWEIPSIRIDEEAAVAFVKAHGTLREQARLAGILTGVSPDKQVVKELEGLQNPDGSFPLPPSGPGGPGSIDATCYVLSQFADLPPLSGSPMATRALSWLRRVQAVDGSWQESDAVAAAAPERTRPGNPLATQYLTAVATYNLLIMAPTDRDAIDRGAAWLRRSLLGDGATGDGPDGGGIQGEPYSMTLVLAWAIWYRLKGVSAPETAAAFTALNGRNRPAFQLAWLLSCALEVGAGGPYLRPVVDWLATLAGRQQPDGSWPPEAGLPVEATLSALRVFRGYGLL